jgi:hypothetical protein
MRKYVVSVRRAIWSLSLMAAVAGLVCVGAQGHDGLGRAQPNLGLSVVGSGKSQRIIVAVVDLDSGFPIPTVRVAASAKRVGMTTRRPAPLLVKKQSTIRYLISLAGLGNGAWKIALRAYGINVVPMRMTVDVERG